ncbi:TPA: hypothetical protein PZN16_003010 [Staphylococcus aureus]|nr:hypothetical protein [Staphylococcus aureus]
MAQHQAEPLQLSPQQRQSCQEQLALYRRLEDADEVHWEILDREREQAQTVAAVAVGKDLPAAEDIEVVFAEYTSQRPVDLMYESAPTQIYGQILIVQARTLVSLRVLTA